MEVEVEELRIGNLVQNKDGVCTLRYDEHTRQLWLQADKDGGESDEGMNPIPLTEEWLVKFGFEKRFFGENLSHYFANTNKIWKIVYNKGVFKRDGLEIKNVHQLQNLYFALTGEELTIKNK